MARLGCFGVVLIAVGISPAGAQTFVGQNFEGTAAGITSLMPDTMGSAGIDYYVELNNKEFRVYRKSDGFAQQSKSLNQFWTDAGVAPLNNHPFDPRIVYDPHARRWYAVSADGNQNANNFLFAISSSSDPTQPWTGFQIDSDTDDSNWADFPMIGYSPEAVYLSANMPPLTALSTRMSFVGIPKASLLQPVPTTTGMALLEDVPRPPGTNALTPQLTVDASNLIGLNTSLPVLMHDFVAGTVYRAELQPLGSPAVTNIGVVGVPAAADPPTVVQPGAPAVQNLEANDGRVSANAVLVNGEIHAVQSFDDGGLAAVRYMRIDAATNAVLESQTIPHPAGLALTFPSIAVNDFGDVVIGVTGTSTTEFASSYAVVGKNSGGITMFNPPMLLKAGVADYERLDSANRNRWGDYSATTVDPADPGIFWTNQEFVKNTNQWGTQVTELIVLQPNEARWVNGAGGMFDDPTMWQTTHGLAPQPTDGLIFSRAVDPGPPAMPTTIVVPPQPVGVYSYQTLSVRQGDVLLDLNGNQLDVALHVEVGPYQGHPQFTVANGTLTSVIGAIAPQPTSEGHMTLDNAHWTVNDVVVGSAPAPTACCGLPGATGGIGSLTIQNGSQLDVAGTLTIYGFAAVNLVDGVLAADTIRQFGPPLPGGGGGSFALNFTGGTLAVNRFDGILINSGGTLAPGGSQAVGTTDVNMIYDQHSVPGGKLAIDIAGAAVGQYDKLTVAGDALLGELDVSFLGGFLPSLGDTFEIVNAGSIPVSGIASLLASTVFPGTGTNWLDWHVFFGPNGVGVDALTLAIVPALTGDFNGNGVVDAADYVVWRNTQGQSGIGLAADSNFDGVVNFIDYLTWRTHFGQSIPGPGSGAGTDSAVAVPEPTSMLLCGLALIGMFGMRRFGCAKTA